MVYKIFKHVSILKWLIKWGKNLPVFPFLYQLTWYVSCAKLHSGFFSLLNHGHHSNWL